VDVAVELLTSAVQRHFVVGDVHGCADELDALLKKAGFQPGDQLVLAGDLCAKGPDSAGVVARAMERGAKVVLGNHDAHVLDCLDNVSSRKHHLAVGESLTAAQVAFLRAVPLWLDLPDFGALVVHAGVLPGHSPESTPRHLLLNLRSIDEDGRGTSKSDGLVPWAKRWTGPERIIFGHDARRGIQRHRFALGLDSGCVYGKSLTGVWLPDWTLVSVDAARAYQPIDE
jgi:hypothetical protein